MPQNRSSVQRPHDLLRPLAGRRATTGVGADDPAVRDHLVHHVPVLPGVFLLDLVLRTVQRAGVDPGLVVLRRIVFHAPIVGSGDRCAVEVVLGDADPGQPLPVTVRSRPAGSTRGPWETNCTAEIHPVDGTPWRHIDPAGLAASATRTIDVDELYGYVRALDIHHRGFMQASGTVHVAPGHALARMRLADEAAEHVGHFHAHPAVLDFATLVPMLLFPEQDLGTPRHAYIPLYIESLRARTGVGAENLVHVPGPVTGGFDSELFQADIAVCDPDGQVVAELVGFRAKRVRSAALITDRTRPPAERTPRPATPAPVAASPAPASVAASPAPVGAFEERVAALVARRLGVEPARVDRELGFYECGLSSVDLLSLVGDLEEMLGTDLYPTLLFEHPTVRRLADHLREEHPEHPDADRLGAGERQTDHASVVGDRAAVGRSQDGDRAVDRSSPPAGHQAADRPSPLAGHPAADSPSPPAALPVPTARPADGAAPEPLAIVGLAGRYPGARTPDQLWEVLADGKDRATPVPPERWDHEPYFDPNRGTPGRTYSRWGAFCDGVAEFDAPFFHLTARQAELMDPHERLLLQAAWEAIEDAGHTPEGLAAQTGRAVGVFAGAMWNDYQLHGLERLRAGTADVAGSWSSALSNRLSYFFDFAGPSLTVDTACSASLAALHLAADAIRRGECRAALVGGVNLSLHPYKYLRLAELGLLSPTGRCRPFGRDADGYVPGEGVGALLLRPLSDALASGDHVYGLLRGSALLHSGRTGGYSVPSPEAQARVVSAALADAGVAPRTIGYVEAHASGTALGDQIEVEALTSVYARHTSDLGYCVIGSAKPVVGHLEAAAGMAGLTKALLALRHRTLPAVGDIGAPAPGIHWERTPFRLPTHPEPWPAPADPNTGHPLPRRAAVSAFGAGGANAHVVIEEYTVADAPEPPGSGGPFAVPLSARSADRLREQAGRLADHLRAHPHLRLADVAHTLRAGRRAMEHRLAVVAASTAELADALRAFADGRPPAHPAYSGAETVGTGTSGATEETEAARLWAAGGPSGWPALDGARRISLPTYPFERRRYWLGDTGPGEPTPTRDKPLTAGPDGPATLLYVPDTRPLPLPVPATAPVPDGPLLLLDADTDRVREMRALHPDVVRVRPGMSYRRISGDEFEIDPGDAGHYVRLTETLRAENRAPGAVLHLWPLSGDTTGDTSTGGVLSALLLCRALAVGPTRPLPVVYAYAAHGASPAHAAVGGLARSVRLEQPKLLLKTVWHQAPAVEARTLLAEAYAPADVYGTEIRHTARGRLTEVFVPAGPPAASPTPVRLGRPGGVYLITGGAGGLGLHTARRIAAAGDVCLALLGRSPGSAHTDRAVADLGALGARAAYFRADVTDPDALSAAVREVRARFGPLTGVVHAAGVLDDSLVVNKSRPGVERVLAPKLSGVAALDAVTSDDRLDYLLLYSSLAAAAGSAGGADYSAANRALDAYAAWREERRRAGERHGATVAVDWPLWRDGGMHIDPALQDRVLARTGSVPLDTATALDTLDTALGLGAERVVVLHGDAARLKAALETPRGAAVSGDAAHPASGAVRGAARSASAEAASGAARPASAAAVLDAAPDPDPDPDPRAPLDAHIVTALTTALRRAGKETRPSAVRDAGFMALGLNSLELAALTSEVSAWLGVDLPATTLFRYPDTDRLVSHLLDTHPDAVHAALRREAAPVPDGAARTDAPAPQPRAVADERGGAPGAEQPVAVIGMAGRFPGSEDIAGFWADLVGGRDLVTDVPADRWDHRLYHDPRGERPDATDCGHGGFLTDVSRFDAAFFGLTPAEAEGLDPQTRQLMEVLHRTAEDAGVAGRLRGSATGTFVGRCFSDYDQAMTAAGRRMGAHDVTGTSVTMAANRIAHHFDLAGPSLVVDTACSSSLYALHLAVAAVRRGECDMAFAAGTNLILDPQHYVRSSALGALSPSGRCHTFDARADGYVPAEAVVAVLVKPLDRALADGDPIHAVVREVGVNHGGRAGSVTAPSPERQTQLLLDTWARAGIEPDDLGYLEAHGTGTALGDPIEIEGAVEAFRRHTARSAFCAVGSAKAHLGHAEGAAGLVGVVKAVLQIQHGVIPAMPDYRQPNPHCRFDGTPLYVNTRPVDWPARDGRPRIAGVSSFGFGGSYAHAVIEQAPVREAAPAPRRPRLFPYSARDGAALRRLVRGHRDFLAAAPGTPLDRMAATLHHGREAMAHRVVLVADSSDGLLAAMDAHLADPDASAGVHVAATAEEPGAALLEAARAWAAGAPLPATAAPDPATARVSLPTYPFGGARYWFAEAATGRTAPDAVRPAARQPAVPAADGAQPTAAAPAETRQPTVTAPAEARQPAVPAGARQPAVPADDRQPGAPAEARRPAVPGGAPQPTAPAGARRPAVPAEVRDVELHIRRSGFDGRRAAEGMERLNDLLRRWCAHLLADGGTPPTAQRLRALLADEEGYGRLADALAALMAKTPPASGTAAPDFTAEASALAAEHPELAPWLKLVQVCLPRLPEILTGRADALEVFFSPDHPDLLLGIYDGNTVADHHNEIVARLVAGRVRALRESRPDRPVRLIEIGGGTGGTTRRLLEAIAEHGEAVQYRFTDVSPAFLPAARARFAGTPVDFTCAVLDLDRDPLEQGFGAGSADIVVAANSVHATRHLGESLGRIRRLLAPSGVLVLEELVRNHDCMTAMIGPLPGYWSAVDVAARLPHSPFFDVPRWRAALAEQGFEATWALGAPDLPETEFDNAVLFSQVPAAAGADGGTGLPGLAEARPQAPARSAPPESRRGGPRPPEPRPQDRPAAVPEPVTADADEVRERLVPVFARFFGLEAGQVDTAVTFDHYGMDSLSAIQLVRSLEPEFGRLPKVLLYEHPTIDSLAAHLAEHAPVASRKAEHAPVASPDRTGTAVAASDADAQPPRETPDAVHEPAAAAPEHTPRPHPAPAAGADADDPVAIVGMAGRFARSPDLRAWWRHLRDGTHLVGEIPPDRFDWREVFGDPHRTPGTVNSRWGSFIEGVDRFDADFFGMTPLEAELMDPQQRIMLQTAWQAVEDAGHRPASLRGSRTGVFVGATSRDYDWQLHRAGRHREGHVVSGNGHCLIANRISYQLDLRGPSEAVDTACSSSLTALHRAVRAVRSGECEAALVGGVHLFLTADLFVALGQLGIMSPDGRCAAFDRRANGMVRGEGAVAVLVKPLSRALADGDTVYALVRGSGVSHGGGGHMDSLMMPNPTAQADLIATVYRDAGVDPRTVGYVEAHGTGTEVGDPIEVRGLRKAFAALDGRPDGEPVDPWCLLGTVKSNVGHTEAAAGLTGVVKTVLAMRHGMLPPTLHFTEANPLLDLDGSPFRVVDRLTPWPAGGSPRRAGVSAFGLGGTNAHVLLEDWPDTRPAAPDAGPVVVPLSARTPERLRARLRELHGFLTQDAAGQPGPLALTDIAHTLAVGRDPMAHRAAFVAATTDQLAVAVRRLLDDEPGPDTFTGRAERQAGGRGADERADTSAPVTDPYGAARRWVSGAGPLPATPGRRVPLPAYPFEEQRHWAEPLEPLAPAPAPVTVVAPAPARSLPDLLQALNEGRLSVDEAERLMEGAQ
ncbi:SDR family NAD(P)-dependent oxidoreductase [Streptomyces sp. NPDC051207]|uniref:SDR family NAD(P)-dependent oxidoreductase n=1 Tax=Streptomyces sp. NPDC051207 TaxID=3154641 RepID=UPI003436F899